MSRKFRKQDFFAIASVALLAVLAGALLIPGRPARSGQARSTNLPYYRRTGFLSKFLQDVDSGARGVESIQVPEGFEVEVAAGPDLVNYPMFIAYDDRGRLFVCESAGRNVSDED